MLISQQWPRFDIPGFFVGRPIVRTPSPGKQCHHEPGKCPMFLSPESSEETSSQDLLIGEVIKPIKEPVETKEQELEPIITYSQDRQPTPIFPLPSAIRAQKERAPRWNEYYSPGVMLEVEKVFAVGDRHEAEKERRLKNGYEEFDDIPWKKY